MHTPPSLRNRRDPHSVKSNYFRIALKVLMGVTGFTLAAGYAFKEVRDEPELAKLRNDRRYHEIVRKYESAKPRPR